MMVESQLPRTLAARRKLRHVLLKLRRPECREALLIGELAFSIDDLLGVKQCTLCVRANSCSQFSERCGILRPTGTATSTGIPRQRV